MAGSHRPRLHGRRGEEGRVHGRVVQARRQRTHLPHQQVATGPPSWPATLWRAFCFFATLPVVASPTPQRCADLGQGEPKPTLPNHRATAAQRYLCANHAALSLRPQDPSNSRRDPLYFAVHCQLLKGSIRAEFLTCRNQPPFLIHLPNALPANPRDGSSAHPVAVRAPHAGGRAGR
jgi:hypothetical protein